MDSTLKRTWAEIDLDALKYNYRIIKKKINNGVKFLGVVKADAYGHGSVVVARTLEKEGADYLAVSSIDEALELRLNGINIPILILGHTPKEQVGRLIEYNITQTVSCKAKAIEYSDEATKFGRNLNIHIKVDTGMSRLGFLCDGDFFETGVDGICETLNLPGLNCEGIFTHFAVSDEVGAAYTSYTMHQFELFENVIEKVEERWGKKFAIKHCANTGAVACYPQTYLDMVRPGLLLYGYGEFAKELKLKPVMTLKTIVSTIKIYPKDTFISYGGIYKTTDTTRVGVVPYGYADGLFRRLSDKYSLMTSDGQAKILGKICMDMCMIDLTDKPNVKVGSEVEIFGKNNSIDNMAMVAETIPYEITCAVSKRVPRVFIENSKVVEKELLLRL